jgi:hypothetical protein
LENKKMDNKLIELEVKDPRWFKVLRKGLAICDSIEFNVLYLFPGKELKILLNKFNGTLVSPEKDERFFYSHRKRISIPKTVESIEFLLSKDFEEWEGELIEDPALIKENKEILGSITHEMLCQIDTTVLSCPNE